MYIYIRCPVILEQIQNFDDISIFYLLRDDYIYIYADSYTVYCFLRVNTWDCSIKRKAQDNFGTSAVKPSPVGVKKQLYDERCKIRPISWDLYIICIYIQYIVIYNIIFLSFFLSLFFLVAPDLATHVHLSLQVGRV